MAAGQRKNLDNWVRQEMFIQQHPYHSKKKSFIGVIKFLIAAAALFLIAFLIVWPIVNSDSNRLDMAFWSIETTDADTPKMIHPRFQGVDANNQPYNVTAQEAIQDGEDIVTLQRVEGDITLNTSDWISLSSDQGTIDMKTKQMDLSGQVSMFTDSGFEFHTTTAMVDLGEGIAVGRSPVHAQGPTGVLRAKGFIIKERGNRIIFNGPVKLTIFPIQ